MAFSALVFVKPDLSIAGKKDTKKPGAVTSFKTFTTPLPGSSEEWDLQKTELRKKLWTLLGDLPPLFNPEVILISKEDHQDYTLEHFKFDNGIGDMVYGYLMIPAGYKGRGPAVLYNHYHGGKFKQGKEELLREAFMWLGKNDVLTGPELVKAGYVVMCIDQYAFGERMGQNLGKQGSLNRLSRAFLWQGKTLWGMMVRDNLLALNYLTTRKEVDVKRIAAIGMSMGSNMSWWTAAMDERIKVTVSISCLTRYQEHLAGGLSKHALYFCIPGMLKEKIDVESIVGLIAPRPHLTLTGARDYGSPTKGVEIINSFQENLYGLYNNQNNFRGILYPDAGHVLSPEMWKETLKWLESHL